MRRHWTLAIAAALVLAGFWASPDGHSDEPPDDVKPTADPAHPQQQGAGVPLEVARDRAKLLSDVYMSTLDVIHHKYFHRERAIVPARAMEDVFADMKRQSKIDARWIAVSLKPMSINHEPKTEFEKRAVREIKSGKREFELVDAGYYRRATAIPLTGGCASCHEGLFSQSTKKLFAGLVISVPIESRSEPE